MEVTTPNKAKEAAKATMAARSLGTPANSNEASVEAAVDFGWTACKEHYRKAAPQFLQDLSREHLIVYANCRDERIAELEKQVTHWRDRLTAAQTLIDAIEATACAPRSTVFTGFGLVNAIVILISDYRKKGE